MSPRIAIRNKIAELVKQIDAFTDANVTFYKLDRVDKTPHTSIYLQSMNSQRQSASSDCHHYDRELTIMVDFYIDDRNDADAQADDWCKQLEQIIYDAERNNEFPDELDDIYLDFAEFRPTEGGKEKRGDCVTAWRVEFSESLRAS